MTISGKTDFGGRDPVIKSIILGKKRGGDPSTAGRGRKKETATWVNRACDRKSFPPPQGEVSLVVFTFTQKKIQGLCPVSLRPLGTRGKGISRVKDI